MYCIMYICIFFSSSKFFKSDNVLVLPQHMTTWQIIGSGSRNHVFCYIATKENYFLVTTWPMATIFSDKKQTKCVWGRWGSGLLHTPSPIEAESLFHPLTGSKTKFVWVGGGGCPPSSSGRPLSRPLAGGQTMCERS